MFLAPRMAGDLFLVIAKVTQSASATGASAGLLLAAFYCLVVWSQRLAKKVTLLSEGQALQPGQQAPAARQQAPQAMNQRGRAPARWRSYRAPESWLRGSFHGSARQCGA